jgi:hypothetical protein
MPKRRGNLDYIIIKSFKEAKKYLNENGIKVEDDLKLIILKSPEELIQKYGKDKVNEYTGGIYNPETKEIYIIKNSIENFVKSVSSNLNESSISNLFTISRNEILLPVYKNDNDIKKIIEKTIIYLIVNHEIGHAVLHLIDSNDDEWKASVFEFLVYFYRKELYKYLEVYEIMEKNTKKCEKFIQEENPNPSTLGYCFANDIIYACENILNKTKKSPKLNIKGAIERFKYFSKDYVETTRTYNMALRDYIAAAKMYNEKYTMLRWITNFLLEKSPNIMDNING